MREIQQLLIFVSLSFSAPSIAQNNPFKAVQDLFSAISEVNHIKMRDTVTSDFQLLEVGEDWDIDDLVEVVTPSEFVRRHYFNVLTVKISDEMAWVSH